VSEIYENASVLSEDYDESGVRYRVRADPATLARLEALLA
jgi:GTP-binding protein HflX